MLVIINVLLSRNTGNPGEREGWQSFAKGGTGIAHAHRVDYFYCYPPLYRLFTTCLRPECLAEKRINQTRCDVRVALFPEQRKLLTKMKSTIFLQDLFSVFSIAFCFCFACSVPHWVGLRRNLKKQRYQAIGNLSQHLKRRAASFVLVNHRSNREHQPIGSVWNVILCKLSFVISRERRERETLVVNYYRTSENACSAKCVSSTT